MRLIGLVLALSLALAPLAAEAQQKEKVYRIGLLSIATVTYIDAFRQGRRWSRSKPFQTRRKPYGPGNLYNPTRRQALRDSQGGSPDNHYRGSPLESWLCGIQCVESGGSATGYGSSRPGGRCAAWNA